MNRVIGFYVEFTLTDERGGTAIPSESDLEDFLSPAAAIAWSDQKIDVIDVMATAQYDSLGEDDEDPNKWGSK